MRVGQAEWRTSAPPPPPPPSASAAPAPTHALRVEGANRRQALRHVAVEQDDALGAVKGTRGLHASSESTLVGVTEARRDGGGVGSRRHSKEEEERRSARCPMG